MDENNVDDNHDNDGTRSNNSGIDAFMVVITVIWSNTANIANDHSSQNVCDGGRRDSVCSYGNNGVCNCTRM